MPATAGVVRPAKKRDCCQALRAVVTHVSIKREGIVGRLFFQDTNYKKRQSAKNCRRGSLSSFRGSRDL